jgi:hypothetical protein
VSVGVRAETQISVRVPDEVGAGAAVFQLLARSNVHLLAFGGYRVDSRSGILHFLPKDPELAMQVLEAAGYSTQKESVIVIDLPEDQSAMAAVTRCLAECGINLTNIYSAFERSGRSTVVLSLSEPSRTLEGIEAIRTIE